MTIAGLNLPLQVPWERMCVSQDMLESDVCSEDHLPKWRSSIAVWRYVPEEEYQIYTGRKIVYLKVTATITGYQPRDKELEGRFRGPPKSRTDVDSILDSFMPCTGAIVQVTIGPHDTHDVKLVDYPYFMDFQPKKRELYEMATDTQERISRSLEETKVGKASGTAQSQEVLDVDQGYSSGGSGGVSVVGTGAGGSSSAAAQGQWGSKHLSSDQLSVNRSSDESRERRETQSHTTQLSQMYNLLDSYHVGTNRAVFLISPRPHVLDEPSGLVKGPRPVDGIQEFFLVVNQPKDQEHLCVSVRLDTGHLTTVPILDFERRPAPTVGCEAHPPLPTKEDPSAPEHQLAVLDADDGERVGTFYYACHQTTDHKSNSFNAPSGFLIEDWNELPGRHVDIFGSSQVEITPSGGTLTVTCDATSRRCFFRRWDVDWGYQFHAPDVSGVMLGSSVREVEPLLRSITKTKKIGDKKVLLLTTRGVCCCTDGTELVRGGVLGVGAIDASPDLVRFDKAKVTKTAGVDATHSSGAVAWRGPGNRMAEEIGAVSLSSWERDGPTMTAREANELGARIKEGILRLHSISNAPAVPYVETDLFIHQVQQQLAQSPEGRAILTESVGNLVRGRVGKKLAEHLDRRGASLARGSIVEMPTEQLAEVTGLAPAAARRLKLQALGFSFSGRTDGDEVQDGGDVQEHPATSD